MRTLHSGSSADCIRGQNHFILSAMVTSHLIPNDIAQDYEVHEWRNAAGVLLTATRAME